MATNRVYVGRIPFRCDERDIERFFRGIGRIRDIMLKSGYCFVEFEHPRDVQEAVYECNGQVLCGERVTVEPAKGTPHGEDLKRDAERGIQYHEKREFERPLRPKGEFRLLVENLSTRISWQELKEMMHKIGEVTFADAHRERRNEGIVEFVKKEDLVRAMEEYEGLELNGRRIRLHDISPAPRKRSHSPPRQASRGSASSGGGGGGGGGDSEEEWRRKRRKREKSDSNKSDHTGSDVEDGTESEGAKRDVENGYDKLLDEEEGKDGKDKGRDEENGVVGDDDDGFRRHRGRGDREDNGEKDEDE